VLDHKLLGIYLNDHRAASFVASELARRAASSNAGTPYGDALAKFADEAVEDRQALEELMARLGVGKDRVKALAAYGAEKVGRLKLNGRLLGYSPLSRVVEIEALVLGVTGKKAMWRALRKLENEDPRLAASDFETLLARADSQARTLERLRVRASREALVHG
jgi:hypothetical protein